MSASRVFSCASTWISLVTPMNESCHIYEWVPFACCRVHLREWVMSHIWMSHVTHVSDCLSCVAVCMYVSESCHTHEWGMSHVRMSASRVLPCAFCSSHSHHHTTHLIDPSPRTLPSFSIPVSFWSTLFRSHCLTLPFAFPRSLSHLHSLPSPPITCSLPLSSLPHLP